MHNSNGHDAIIESSSQAIAAVSGAKGAIMLFDVSLPPGYRRNGGEKIVPFAGSGGKLPRCITHVKCVPAGQLPHRVAEIIPVVSQLTWQHHA